MKIRSFPASHYGGPCFGNLSQDSRGFPQQLQVWVRKTILEIRIGQGPSPLAIIQYLVSGLQFGAMERVPDTALTIQTRGMHKQYEGGCHTAVKCQKQQNICYIRFEIFTVATKENAVFWDVTPCSSCKNRRFGRT
jgi:hypothetical protein